MPEQKRIKPIDGMSKEHPIDWRGDLWKKREFFCESPPVRGDELGSGCPQDSGPGACFVPQVMASFRKADSTGIFIAGV